jgi:hypothetical protein
VICIACSFAQILSACSFCWGSIHNLHVHFSLHWCWGVNSNHYPGCRSFKFKVSENTRTQNSAQKPATNEELKFIQCIEAGIEWLNQPHCKCRFVWKCGAWKTCCKGGLIVK